MRITANLNISCPSGFYCMKNGSNRCYRLEFKNNLPYCEVFYPFLDTDSNGNVIKCEQCLLAERKARLEE